MAYQSLDQFLQNHTEDLIALLEMVQAEIGGYFAGLTPPAARGIAEQQAAQVSAALRTGQIDPPTVQQNLQARAQMGIPVDEAARFMALLEPQLRAFIAEQLAGQPELHAEIERRLAHLMARYRASVTAVQMDQVLRRLPGSAPAADSADTPTRA